MAVFIVDLRVFALIALILAVQVGSRPARRDPVNRLPQSQLDCNFPEAQSQLLFDDLVGYGFNLKTETRHWLIFRKEFSTCNNKTYANRTWLIPDGCDMPKGAPPGKSFVNQSIINIYQSAATYFKDRVDNSNMKLNLEYGGVKLTGAYSKTRHQAEKWLDNGKNSFSFALIRAIFLEYQCPFRRPWLKSDFLAALDALPPYYRSHTSYLYTNFFEYYGTHFVWSSYYGYAINSTSVFSSQLVNHMKSDELQQNIEISMSVSVSNFSLDFGWSKGVKYNESSIEREFRLASSTDNGVLPQEPELLAKQGYLKWAFQKRTMGPMHGFEDFMQLFPWSQIASSEAQYKDLKQATIDYINGVIVGR